MEENSTTHYPYSHGTKEVETQTEELEKLLRGMQNLPGMDRVEQTVSSKLCSFAPLLEEIPKYLLTIGGKRMRPALALLTAQAFGMNQPSDALIDVAAGIELIHMATLLHDDIIDHAPLRRKKTSPLAKYGVSNTLLSGDFLLVRAFSLCSRLDQFIIDETEISCIELTEGEILELSATLFDTSLEQALEIGRRKTASLFRLAAVSAGYLSGVTPRGIESLRRFGDALGVAFQILDDILDVTSTEEVLGKRPGTDLRELKPSAINVLWMETESELAKAFRGYIESPSEQQVQEAIHEIQSGQIPKRARELAILYTDRAREALQDAAESCVRETAPKVQLDLLTLLIDYTVSRLH